MQKLGEINPTFLEPGGNTNQLYSNQAYSGRSWREPNPAPVVVIKCTIYCVSWREANPISVSSGEKQT